MTETNHLAGKKVLIVDDEPDVLETLEELLYMCETTRAGSFQEAKDLLETQPFDMAVLDIMGVEGFKLLEIAKEKEILAVMLTAHGFSRKNTIKSFEKGAAYFVPKEEMARIATFLNDVLESAKKGRSFWSTWMDRLGDHYEKKYGKNWQDQDKSFWQALMG